jgi:hypothetical protein
MNEDEASKLQAACWERYTLLNQAIRKHEENMQAELKRFELELKQMDTMFAIRLGRDLPWSTPPE